MANPPQRRFYNAFVGILAAIIGLSALRGCIVATAAAYNQPNSDAVGNWVMAWIFGVAALIIFGSSLIKRQMHRRWYIDARLDSLLGGVRRFRAYNKVLPRFRFVDVRQAAASVAKASEGWVEIETSHVEPLSAILNRRFFQPGSRRLRRVEMISRLVGPGKEDFFAADNFWVLPAAVARKQGGDPCLIRVRQGPQPHQTTLEVAARDARQGTALIERLVRLSAEHSIYRNHLLDLEVAGEVRDEDGNIEQTENLDLVFKAPPRIGPADIVLDDGVARALERNVLDFHRRREALTALGLPSRRGVLLYGPPGTGKTYTCKYLTSQLAGTITTLVASGESLLRVRTICNLARMLQPALVVLEDVDLVYAARESGLGHNASLGKLMDELDGFGRDDRIIFVLTTNAIDRVERAISDRPGRISQCVYLGPPSDPLRHRYLQAQLAPYDGSALDLDRLTGMTDGTTQAFLKELVFRAVQIASLDATPPGTNGAAGKLALRDEHFAAAMTEMRSAGGRAGESIIGFRTAGF